MNLPNKLGRIVGGASLALALTLAPAAWGLSTSPAAQKSSSATATHSQANPLDINTATESQLKTVSGIGDVYAKRIVQFRPYSAKNQLVTRGVLPQGVYDKVKDQLVAHHIKK